MFLRANEYIPATIRLSGGLMFEIAEVNKIVKKYNRLAALSINKVGLVSIADVDHATAYGPYVNPVVKREKFGHVTVSVSETS